MDGAQYTTRRQIEVRRGERGFAWAGDGLWWAGSLAAIERPAVAIVGTRSATPYGRRLAFAFARALAAAGCCIVSGLALGIDSAAHEGALDVPAPTIGVLGGGHAAFFPPRNAELGARMLLSGGAVASPWPPEHPALAHQFLERNAVVAALADAVVVIEAPSRSGALNTANWAAGRIPVLAVPGDVDRRHVAGCHALIRDGAILARAPEDVLEVLSLSGPSISQPPQRDGLAGDLLAALSAGETTLDELAAAAGGRTPDVLAALAVLELEGLVQSRNGRYALAVFA